MYKSPAYVGIILKKNSHILLVQRHNTDWAQGQWNFPGGLLEEHETLLQAAMRETREEVGVIVKPADFKLVHVLQVQKNEQNTKDIIGFYFLAEVWEKEVVNNEPHRHSAAEWFAMDRLPEKITEHARQAIEGLMTGQIYSLNG